jgi:putative FmdB family regulatory protein
MPLYEYQCDACGSRFEQIQKFSDPPVDKCPKCGAGPVHKLLSSPAFQFKGSGWYITDYARKPQPAKSEGASPDGSGKNKDKDKDKAATTEKSATSTPASSSSTTATSSSSPTKSSS